MSKTPAELRAYKAMAQGWCADFAGGLIVQPSHMAHLWGAVSTLASELADLSERMETAENRRVGRPPKNRDDTHG